MCRHRAFETTPPTRRTGGRREGFARSKSFARNGVYARDVTEQAALEKWISKKRLAPYLEATQSDVNKAEQLYLWNTRFSGALHSQIGLFEVIVRNAMDQSLRKWSSQFYNTEDWSSARLPSNEIHVLVAKPLRRARSHAEQVSKNREPGHPRKGVKPDHDDVVTQLSLGAWATMLGETPACSTPEKENTAKALWTNALAPTFSVEAAVSAAESEGMRRRVGTQLQRVTELRNRVAHQENLLQVRARSRFNDMIAIVTSIDPEAAHWFINSGNLRAVVSSDPRKEWARGD